MWAGDPWSLLRTARAVPLLHLLATLELEARMPATPAVSPLEILFDLPARATDATPLPLPPALADLYGTLAFPTHPGRPCVISNFVSALDGVVALNTPGVDDGSVLSGGVAQDKVVMGILRSTCDAVVIGAGTLNAIPKFLLTAGGVFPPLAGAFRALRAALGKPPAPLHVIISGHGELNLSARIFLSGEVPALIVTTPAGQARIQAANVLPPAVTVVAVGADGAPSPKGEGGGRGRMVAGRGQPGVVPAAAVLAAIEATLGASVPNPLVLVEGGPHVLDSFLATRLLDELFLTFSPLVAGRAPGGNRPGFAAGTLFAPADPRWATLVSVRRAGSALFLRYAFPATPAKL